MQAPDLYQVPRLPAEEKDRNPNSYSYRKLIRTRKATIMQKYTLHCQKDLASSYRKAALGVVDPEVNVF